MNHNITDDKLWNLNRIDSEKSNVSYLVGHTLETSFLLRVQKQSQSL